VEFGRAMFAAYSAGGASLTPSSDIPSPNVWLFHAGNNVAWSLSSLFLAFALFSLLRAARPINRYAVAALVIGVLLAIYPFFREYADFCGDNQWSFSELRCLSNTPPGA